MSKHNEFISCDLCGKVVAEIDGVIFKKVNLFCEFIEVPHHYFVYGEWGLPEPEKGKYHICAKCLKDLKADLSFNRKMEREREIEKEVVDEN